MDSRYLRVGDHVLWRGSWGSNAPQPAIVAALEQTSEPHSKYGHEVSSLRWDLVRAGFAVVILENGHWAYGSQLAPLA